jgi:hypothetical protein
MMKVYMMDKDGSLKPFMWEDTKSNALPSGGGQVEVEDTAQLLRNLREKKYGQIEGKFIAVTLGKAYETKIQEILEITEVLG